MPFLVLLFSYCCNMCGKVVLNGKKLDNIEIALNKIVSTQEEDKKD